MKIFNFSELTQKLVQAKSITKEAVQVCQNIFRENGGEVENGDQWCENVRILKKLITKSATVSQNLLLCDRGVYSVQ